MGMVLGISIPLGILFIVLIVGLVICCIVNRRKRQSETIIREERTIKNTEVKTIDPGLSLNDSRLPAPPLPERSAMYAKPQKRFIEEEIHSDHSSSHHHSNHSNHHQHEVPSPPYNQRGRPIKVYPSRKISTTASIHSFKPPPPSRKISEV